MTEYNCIFQRVTVHYVSLYALQKTINKQLKKKKQYGNVLSMFFFFSSRFYPNSEHRAI